MVIIMTENKPIKKDCYSKVTLCQLILLVLMLLAVYIFSSEGVRADYGRIMSYSITKDDFTALASALRDYLEEESAVRSVFENSDTYEYEEASEEVTFSDGMGGDDLKAYEVPSNCSFSSIRLTAPIILPIENGRYTSFFGFRVNPVTDEYGFHSGVDIASSEGSNIRAALSGRVQSVGEDSRAGKYIKISHQNGLITFYCHCSEILAEEGANIRQGETIALVGSTGMSTGPHLHFEIRKNNIRYDPMKVLQNAA